MEKCWRNTKTFVWLPHGLSFMFDISAGKAKKLIEAGKVKVNDVLIKDIDLGLGDGLHIFELAGDPPEIKRMEVNGESAIDDLKFNDAALEALERGEKVQIGQVVAQKVKDTLTVCYHKVPKKFAGTKMPFDQTFPGPGQFLTGCMASV